MSLLRDGDPLADPGVQAQLLRAGITTDPPEAGTWKGFASATAKGVPRGLAEVDALGQYAVGTIAARAHWIAAGVVNTPGIDDKEGLRELDRIYDEDKARSDAAVTRSLDLAHAYRADPMTVGSAGQIGNELAALVPRTIAGTAVGGPVGGAVAAGAPAGFAESDNLQRQGVDESTADRAGALTAVTTGVGAILPGGGVLKGALADTALAAAGNVGLGVVQRKATSELLDANGYHDMAAQYHAFDSTAMGTDLAFSLLLSGAHRFSLPQTNAVLTLKNATSFDQGDGLVPVDVRSRLAAEKAKTGALASVLTGKPVDVAETVGTAAFVQNPTHVAPTLHPDARAAAADAIHEADTYELVADRIIGLESGGKANAKNPLSSATGTGQFVQSTWLSMIRRHRPDLAAGKTKADILALRTDPGLSREMVIEFARENGRALEAAGQEASAANVYLAHHFGASGAVKMLEASPDSLVFDHLNAGERLANPAYRGKTVAQMMAGFERRAGVRGDQLESPLHEAPVATGPRSAFESPDALAAREFEAKARAKGVDEKVARELAPSAAVDSVTGYFDARLDQVKSSVLQRAVAHVEATGEPGYFVSADVHNLGGINAFEGNVADRANTHYSALAGILREELQATGADVVPMRTGGDELGAVVINSDAAKVDMALRNTEARIHEYAQANGLAEIPHHKGAGHSPGTGLHLGAAAIAPGRLAADIFERADRGVNISKNRGKAHVRGIEGRPTETTAADAGATPAGGHGGGGQVRPGGAPVDAGATRQAGQGQGTQVAVDPSMAAVQRVAAETPDHPVLAGFDADGHPTYRPLSQVLAEIQAEQAAAVRDADAYLVGANCFLQNGA